jgi:hypothetical protein
MNKITFRAFRRHMLESGLEVRRLERVPVRGLKRLAAVPILGEAFTQSVRCHAVKAPATASFEA